MSIRDSSHAEKRISGLMHNPGIALHWSASEQQLLEHLISIYSCTPRSKVSLYTLVAHHFKEKTVRDVALRHRWMMMGKHVSTDNRDYPLISTNTDGNGDTSFTDTKELDWQFVARISTNLHGLQSQLDEIFNLTSVVCSQISSLNCNPVPVTEARKSMSQPGIAPELLDRILPFLPDQGEMLMHDQFGNDVL